MGTSVVLGANDVIAFWRDAGPKKWFTKDAAFDESFREQFLHLHERAAAGKLESWLTTAEGALALVILLDQFPRNAFRNSPRMYATDALGRYYAERAIEAGFDQKVDPELRFFFYLPFSHSEQIADQERAVALHETINFTEHAIAHRDVIRRFGRFPHRNAILGRESTAEEKEFLEKGEFAW